MHVLQFMSVRREFTLTFAFLFAQGVRRLGAAAVDLCHVALGLVDAYWEYRLKPWDMAAGVLVSSISGNVNLCAA